MAKQSSETAAAAAQIFDYRIGFLGCPPHPDVEWSEANFDRLKKLGFNTVQLNIAWGDRPTGSR